MDLVLPGTDGIDLMERIPELATLPVIFTSAYGRDEMVARALEMETADYIVKPFSPTELVARINEALRRRDELPRSFPGNTPAETERRARARDPRCRRRRGVGRVA